MSLPPNISLWNQETSRHCLFRMQKVLTSPLAFAGTNHISCTQEKKSTAKQSSYASQSQNIHCNLSIMLNTSTSSTMYNLFLGNYTQKQSHTEAYRIWSPPSSCGRGLLLNSSQQKLLSYWKLLQILHKRLYALLWASLFRSIVG